MNPIDSPHWHSPFRQPERVADATEVPWDDAADFLVVGYGGAGIAAALEAVEKGLEVLALDAFDGGGSRAMNGGVVYAGGGTAIQREAGVEDSVDDMFRYLKLETQGVVKDSTIHGRDQRYCDEVPYGAAIGQVMGDEQDGAGLLILDRAPYRKAWHQVRKNDMLPLRPQPQPQPQPAILALLFASRKARTLEELARKCGLDPRVLGETARDYNLASAGWQTDRFGKDQKDIHAIVQGPFYAIDVSIRSRLFPLSSMTVGGLRVDEDSGQVLRADDTPIGGLYAAGRTAIGLPSHLYISGLSAADCIFSGRRAAAHVAQLAQQQTQKQAQLQQS